MKCFTPRSQDQPDETYQADFCQAELAYLRRLTDDLPTADAPLLDYHDRENRLKLIGAIHQFMPVWCANTSIAGQPSGVIAVYTYRTDDALVYLVDEALRIPGGFTDQGDVPLQRLYEDTWYAFDAFPNPNRWQAGRPVKMP